MAKRIEPNDTANQSNRTLWVAMVALALVAASAIGNGNNQVNTTAPFDDTPNGLSEHLHRAMDNVMAVRSESSALDSMSSQGDTLIFHMPDSSATTGDMKTVKVYVNHFKGGLWAQYANGRMELLAPTVDRMHVKAERSDAGETMILELSAMLPTEDGAGPRRNLHRILTTSGSG
jgi:hypothetical protein